MPNFDKVVDNVIKKSDVVLEILDARFIEETRNHLIEQRAKKMGKILIHVINKCDYVDKKHLDNVKKNFEHCVFVSAKDYFGLNLLKEKIMILASKKKIHMPIVGVIGYPNVGKSSLINAMKGEYSARTSSEAGYTKGKQYLRVGKNILMIDTPGVISKHGKNDDLVLVGAKNPHMIKDPDMAVIKLIEENPGRIEKKYGVEAKEDKEEIIKDIARKFNLIKKGNLPDIERTSMKILQDWINGRIK